MIADFLIYQVILALGLPCGFHAGRSSAKFLGGWYPAEPASCKQHGLQTAWQKAWNQSRYQCSFNSPILTLFLPLALVPSSASCICEQRLSSDGEVQFQNVAMFRISCLLSRHLSAASLCPVPESCPWHSGAALGTAPLDLILYGCLRLLRLFRLPHPAAVRRTDDFPPLSSPHLPLQPVN